MSTIEVLEVAPGSRSKLLGLYGRTIQSIKIDVDNIKDWLRKQPHLPELPEDSLIEKFLFINKFHIEDVKVKLDVYFSIRSLFPEFYGQDPLGESARSVTSVVYLVPLPKATSGLSRIVCFKLRNTTLEDFNLIDSIGYLMNIIEVRLREDFCLSDIYILDLDGTTAGHLLKMYPSVLKKLSYLIENLFKVSIEGIHIVNAPTFIESALSLFSKYFKEKVMNRIKVHHTLDSLHEAVPKCYLPTDLGGTQKSLEQDQAIWKMKLAQFKPTLEHLNALKVNENLRPVKLSQSDLLGIDGNFRQLDVD